MLPAQSENGDTTINIPPHLSGQSRAHTSSQLHLDSLNGESSPIPRVIVPPPPPPQRRYLDDVYACHYAPLPSTHYPVYPQPSVPKPSYRCNEELQRYPQRCRDDYNHRCSEGNLLANEQHQQQQRYWSDVHKYFRRKAFDDAEVHKYAYPTEDRCLEHPGSFIGNRILSPGGLPILGQTALGLVVNRFGSGTLVDPHQRQYMHPYVEPSFCPCEGSGIIDKEDYLDARFMMHNSMSDSDDM